MGQTSTIISRDYATPGVTPITNNIPTDLPNNTSSPAGTQHYPLTPTALNNFQDFDPDARLVDVTDESWGLVLSRPLVDPLLPTSRCAATASGYLLKRAGTREDDGLIAAAIDIIHPPSKGKEAALKEVLCMYRDLAALARMRGLVNRWMGIAPLHVAASIKAFKGVNEMMSWDVH